MEGLKQVFAVTTQIFGTQIRFGQFKFTLLQLWCAMWAIGIIVFFIRKVFVDD